LKSKIIFIPELSEFELLSQGFYAFSELNGTLKAVDGTHILIDAPTISSERYINRKGTHSVNYLMGCDYKGRIRYVFGPGYGSSHDAFLYSLSKLKYWVESEIPFGFHVIGDSAFPSNQNFLSVIKGSSERTDVIFNNLVSSQRMKIEGAIGALKTKFRKFLGKVKNGECPFYRDVFISCIVIHNILINFK
jgi:hypothetical protein